MAKVIEVDETDYQNGQQTIAAVREIMAHPEAALLIERARKLVKPDVPTPRLDAHKQANEPIEKLHTEIAELKKSLAEEKAETEKNSKLAMLADKVEKGNARLKAEGWTTDGLKALDEFREKEGILDPIHAAAVYEKLHGAQVAPATPSGSSGIGTWDFTAPSTQDEEFTKKLLETRGESESLVMGQAMKSLAEFRGNNRR
jgi:hypothetical protein